MAGVLSWLDGLDGRKPMLIPMQDVGPVWQGGVAPTANAHAPGPLSLAALRRAWLIVRRNKGGAGVDGVTLARFEAMLESELVALALAIAEGRYRPQKVKRILVPKPKGGLRPIGIWAIRDRVVQRALFEALVPMCERHFLPASFGYRPGLGVKDALKVVVQARKAGLCWVVDADIKQCFDHIRTKPLLGMLGAWVPDRRLVDLVRCFLQARIFNSASGRRELAGTSQGSVLSPLLSNVYLHRLDEAISRKKGWRLVRFADDFVILTRSQKEAKAAKRLAARVLGKLGLQLHPDKTRVVSFEQGEKELGKFFLRDEVHQV